MRTPTQNQQWAGPFSVRCNPETVTLSVPLNAGTDDVHVLSSSGSAPRLDGILRAPDPHRLGAVQVHGAEGGPGDLDQEIAGSEAQIFVPGAVG